MANDLNQCQFIGRLGRDPELKYMPDGKAVASFRIAVGWKSKQNEGAEWVPVVAFEKLAEICGEYLRKGSQVFISGRFITRKWQDKEGNDRYTTEIIADRMQMLGGRQGAGGGYGEEQQAHGQSAPAQRSQDPERQQRAPAAQPPAGGFDDFDDDDIQF